MANTGRTLLIVGAVIVACLVMAVLAIAAVRVVLDRGETDPLAEAAHDAFAEAGVADELEDEFGDMDADEAITTAQRYALDGQRRVGRDVLAKQTRIEARMVNALPPAECLAVGQGAVTPEMSGAMQEALRDMSERERREHFTIAATLAQASLTRKPLRPPLTAAENRKAERMFRGMFKPAELRQFALLDPASKKKLSDTRGCGIVRLMYERLLSEPEKRLELLSTYLVEP